MLLQLIGKQVSIYISQTFNNISKDCETMTFRHLDVTILQFLTIKGNTYFFMIFVNYSCWIMFIGVNRMVVALS